MIQKFELAFKYYPNAPTKKAATDRLTNAIKRCKPLLMELIKSYYNVHDKEYTPRQVRLIFKYFGEP